MTISVKVLDDQIKKISETNTLLDMLIEFEKVLDDVDIYAFENWSKGEILEGPTLSRHYVNVKLLYPQKSMPDPDGAKRLLLQNCLVKYTKETLRTPVKVKTFDDVSVSVAPDGRQIYKAKTVDQPCWVVSIDVPRKFVDALMDENIAKDVESADAEGKLISQQIAATNTTAMPGQIPGDNMPVGMPVPGGGVTL